MALCSTGKSRGGPSSCAKSSGRASSYHDAALTIIFSRGGDDYGSRFERLMSAQLANRAFDRPITVTESGLSQEVLPNGHGITTTAQAELHELAKRLTGRRSKFGIF